LNAAQMILIGEKLDINEASKEDLQVLQGIGPKLAARIVEDRERQGSFTSVHDLTRVRGIGPKTIRKNRHFLKASPHSDKLIPN
jgi:competence protein ComEA